MITETRLQGVYSWKGKKGLYTKSFAPGLRVYDEQLIKQGKDEFREWNTRKSKLAAGITKGLSQIGIRPGMVVLYLGSSTGTTVSHVSDIVGEDGFVFALDSAPRVMRQLVFVAEQRKNIAPILADANQPNSYAHRICEADIVYQDVAQRNQVEIFLKNCDQFLRAEGFGLVAIKARSIDVAQKPQNIFRDVRKLLEKHLTLVDYRELAPFQKDHCLFVCKKQA